MKRYLIQLIILNVFACSNPQDKETEQQNPQENNIVEPEITQENIATKIEGPKFKETNMQAVLIGNNIELLDNELKTIDNIVYRDQTTGITRYIHNEITEFTGKVQTPGTKGLAV